ncbi:MAG TPA: DUF4149 domain-containing protein [Nitrospiraceae bacterium]|nr:DUF4149 domain-containing protein [Nitrospiraceae bacterium]
MRWLITCYLLELLALAIWIGGLVVIIASVIPAVFNSLGMEAGGRFLTRVFHGYNGLIAGCIVVLVGSGAWRTWLSTRGGVKAAGLTRTELLLLTAMIVVAVLITAGLGPATVQRQEEAFAAEGEAARKAAYEAFFRTHMIVRGLYLLNLGLGIVLTAVKVKTWLKRSIE